jgi:hypothetical protein
MVAQEVGSSWDQTPSLPHLTRSQQRSIVYCTVANTACIATASPSPVHSAVMAKATVLYNTVRASVRVRVSIIILNPNVIGIVYDLVIF